MPLAEAVNCSPMLNHDCPAPEALVDQWIFAERCWPRRQAALRVRKKAPPSIAIEERGRSHNWDTPALRMKLRAGGTSKRLLRRSLRSTGLKRMHRGQYSRSRRAIFLIDREQRYATNLCF